MKGFIKARKSLAFNIIGSLVLILLIFSCIVSAIGYITFSNSLENQYSEYTKNVAFTSSTIVNADNIDKYLADGGEDEEYKNSLHRLNVLCKQMNVSVIYVIKVNDDYNSFLSVFNCVNENRVSYTPWEVGHKEKTTEGYKEIYEQFYAGTLDYAKVIRTTNLNGAPPHITTAIPLKGSDGKTTSVLCVQSPMEELVRGRTAYLSYIAISMLLTAALVSFFAGTFISKQFVYPISKINEEAKRFASENTKKTDDGRLKNISRIDEISTLASSIEKMEQDTVDYIENLTYATSEKERIGTELSIASQIQAGSVPNIFPAFPERNEFDIYAIMNPAKEVGGDFYDFFFIDENHLALVMADVSGKGVPAALMMMVTKILIKERSTIIGGKPSEILEFVNSRICANNRADMFVTVWLGILDLKNGSLISANAGHDYPLVYKAGGRFEMRKSGHGLVIGAVDGAKYKDTEYKLGKGDKIFLYTDGVPEATNEFDELFTMARTIEAVNIYADGNVRDVLNGVKAEVDKFVGYAPQFDDLTMLCLEYNGKGNEGKGLKIKADNDKLGEVTAFAEEYLENAGCSMKAQMQIILALEEMFVNIANYAYGDGEGDAEVIFESEGDYVTITLIDSGIAYNPLAKADPDTTLSAEERQIGGLGIFLVKKNMDDVSYEYKNNQNVFKMTKKIK